MEQLGESINNLKRYIYRDHSKGGDEIIFECEAQNITEADQLYEAKIGKNPEKQKEVGCEVVPLKGNG